MKNLKKIALLICLVAFTKMFGQTAPEVHFETMNSEIPLEELSYQYLLGHKVFLREKPTLKAKKLTVLNIGARLLLREESKNSDEIDGIRSKWYRVETGSQIGWVWGGMIAQKAFGSGADYKVKFVYGYESSKINDAGMVETSYQLRAFKDGYQLDKVVLDSLSSLPIEIQNIGSKGLFNVEDIITVTLMDPNTGHNNGKSYVFWNNGRFANVANLIDYSDASYAKTESFIFPSDMDGIRSTIVLKTTITNKDVVFENEVAQNTERFIRSFYTWNGHKLSAKDETITISKDVVASNSNY